ncbi:hypothetical protein NPIL_12491, partial [Nephila pilipes]
EGRAARPSSYSAFIYILKKNVCKETRSARGRTWNIKIIQI